MTNFEKHKDEILAWARGEYRGCFSPIGSAAARVSGIDDWARLIDWLFAEYEPPLLNNGDGLKPGDWIMVRNHESSLWNKRQFLCFCEHLFVAADDDYSPIVGGMFSSWKFARLPMEGE